MIFNMIIGNSNTAIEKQLIDFSDMRSESSTKYCTGYYDENNEVVIFPIEKQIEKRSYYTASMFGWTPILSESIPQNATYIEFPTSYSSQTTISFAGNTTIEAVCIPDTIQGNLPSNAFNGCTALRCIHISEMSTSILNQVFMDCSSLENFKIPLNVTGIYTNAFANCINLKNVTFNNVLTTLGEAAFYGTGLEKVKLPNSLTQWGINCFADCTSLEEIELSSNLTTIPDYVFATSTGRTSKLKKITNLPGNASSIGNNAFLNCSLLETPINISNCISLGYRAFYGCSSMKGELTIPTSVTSIPNECFYNCSSLERITLHDNITEIGERAFYNCSAAKGLNIPAGLTTLGTSCFEDCMQRTSIIIPYGVTQIPDYCFKNNNNVIQISLPETITHIGFASFSGMTLDNITLPSSILTIGNNAMNGINNNTITMIGSIPPTIGSFAFRYNVFDPSDRIKKIYIPDGTLTAYQNAQGWSGGTTNFAQFLEEYTV